MIKRIDLFRTKPGITREGLRAWWAEHTLMAKKMPGLRGYVTNLVLEELRGDSGLMGVTEFWFDSKADMEKAYDPTTPLRRELSKHGEPVASVASIFLVEERVILPPPHKL